MFCHIKSTEAISTLTQVEILHPHAPFALNEAKEILNKTDDTTGSQAEKDRFSHESRSLQSIII